MTQEKFNILTGQLCAYCRSVPKLVDSAIVYGVSYGLIYYCKECDAYVGVHKGTTRPLGRLANRELRKLKVDAHNCFDRLWKEKYFTRQEAYIFLQKKLKIEKQFCHIGMFDERTCEKVIEVTNKYLKKRSHAKEISN